MDFKYKIDVATPEDTETLVNFQLAMAKESEGTELDYGTVRECIKEGIADDSKATDLVARDEQGQPIGMLMLTTEWSDWNDCNYYWIQSVYVAPEHRHKGVFRELFDFAKAIAESEGAGAFRPEGRYGDGVGVIPIDVGNRIRLYCLRISDRILVFGNGGVKDADSWEHSPILSPIVKTLIDTSRFIKSRINDGSILIHGKELVGN